MKEFLIKDGRASSCSCRMWKRSLSFIKSLWKFEFQIKAVERLVVAERENISAAFERQRAEGLARNDKAFEENLAALDEKAGKLSIAIEFDSDPKLPSNLQIRTCIGMPGCDL